MAYTLEKLPYAYDALEPYIDAQTMELHYLKHYKGYMDGLNRTLEQYPDLQSKPLAYLFEHIGILPEYLQTPIKNFGGGYANHSLFWRIMSPEGGGEPQGILAQAIHDKFGSFEEFKKEFEAAAKNVFGSGWAWLVLGSENQLILTTTPNQNSPLLEGMRPLMGLDVWEHAYYLKYQNRRPDYISAWWNVVNWPEIEENYQKLLEEVS